MREYKYDLHIHSVLSPCGDDDNTPCNIAGMAHLSELDIVALTDHNTCKNCPAFFEAAERYGIIPIAGMELTTSEDIHVVCLFEELAYALDFEKELSSYRVYIKNRPDIFGEQLILNSEDEVIGKEEHLLTNATMLSVEDIPALVAKFRGVAYPAHIDKDANGIISVLGTFPETPKFSALELHDLSRYSAMKEKYALGDKLILTGSDAHYLENIGDVYGTVLLEADGTDASEVRRELIRRIGGL